MAQELLESYTKLNVSNIQASMQQSSNNYSLTKITVNKPATPSINQSIDQSINILRLDDDFIIKYNLNHIPTTEVGIQVDLRDEYGVVEDRGMNSIELKDTMVIKSLVSPPKRQVTQIKIRGLF